jgi:hypothetical protein
MWVPSTCYTMFCIGPAGWTRSTTCCKSPTIGSLGPDGRVSASSSAELHWRCHSYLTPLVTNSPTTKLRPPTYTQALSGFIDLKMLWYLFYRVYFLQKAKRCWILLCFIMESTVIRVLLSPVSFIDRKTWTTTFSLLRCNVFFVCFHSHIVVLMSTILESRYKYWRFRTKEMYFRYYS